MLGRDPLDPGHDKGDVDDAKVLQEYQWDFSITNSITVTLILFYCAQIVSQQLNCKDLNKEFSRGS